MSDYDNIRGRIFEFIREKGLNKSRFEKEAGLSNGYINNVKGKFSMKKLEQILNAFPDLNRDWLLYGEGDMLKDSVSNPVPGYDTLKDKQSILKAIMNLTEAELLNATTRERNSRSIERMLNMIEQKNSEKPDSQPLDESDKHIETVE